MKSTKRTISTLLLALALVTPAYAASPCVLVSYFISFDFDHDPATGVKQRITSSWSTSQVFGDDAACNAARAQFHATFRAGDPSFAAYSYCMPYGG